MSIEYIYWWGREEERRKEKRKKRKEGGKGEKRGKKGERHKLLSRRRVDQRETESSREEVRDSLPQQERGDWE